MQYLFWGVVGGTSLLFASWAVELMKSRRLDGLRMSREERTAHDRTEKLLKVFGDRGLAKMDRREIREKIRWIWISSRMIALRSGRWSVIFWLFLQGFACLALICKTIFVPDSHDLRLLLGGRDFLAFFVAAKGHSGPLPDPKMRAADQSAK